jgi:hypothetical protein
MIKRVASRVGEVEDTFKVIGQKAICRRDILVVFAIPGVPAIATKKWSENEEID